MLTDSGAFPCRLGRSSEFPKTLNSYTSLPDVFMADLSYKQQVLTPPDFTALQWGISKPVKLSGYIVILSAERFTTKIIAKGMIWLAVITYEQYVGSSL